MQKKKTCIALTGAGISADSGIATFRGAGGLWEGHNVEDVATPEAFARNPQLVIDFYNARRRQLPHVQPNAAHLALAELESAWNVHVITQNVDDLHERAGSTQVLHLHGELTKLRSTANAHYVVDWHQDQTLDDCDPQGHRLRPHIVWFGEAVPLIGQAATLVQQADVVLVIGTSLQVYPAAGLVDYAPAHARIWLIDPHPAALLPGVQVVAERASMGVVRVVQQLLQEAEHAHQRPHGE